MTTTRLSRTSAPSLPSNRAKYMTLIAAFLGWLFDGFEMGLFPLIGQPALKDLLGPDSPPTDAAKWFGAIIAVFLVGAASGGVLFGCTAELRKSATFAATSSTVCFPGRRNSTANVSVTSRRP